jgi:predicted RNase H-like nuclease
VSDAAPIVLGIDAAWTATQPSGVALTRRDGDRFVLLAVDSSYGNFYARAAIDGPDAFDAGRLLAATEVLAGARATLIAMDYPLAHRPIVGRRPSDNAISRAYGGRHAGTHSPSATRPGPLADRMRSDFASEGYALQTGAPVANGLIEVYPHPALIELAQAPFRLPYKASKTAKYWPGATLPERRTRLLSQWVAIIAALEPHIDGIANALPPPAPGSTGRSLKAYEDALDAIICAWIGICALDGLARPYGDDDSAIWVPALRPK